MKINNRLKTVKCWNCMKYIEITYDTWKHGIDRRPGDPQFYCKECYNEIKRNRMKNLSWNNLNDEDKIKRSNKISESFKNMDSKKREEMKKSQSIKMKEHWSNMSEEDKMKHNEFVKHMFENLPKERQEEIRNNAKERWANMPKEVKDKMARDAKERYESLSDKYKEEYSKIRKEWYNNLSDEEKEKRRQQIKDRYANMNENELHEIGLRVKNWYDSLSDKEKEEYSKSKREIFEKYNENIKEKIKDNLRNYYNNLSDKDQKEFVEKSMHKWNNLSEDERGAITRKKLSSNKNNNLQKKFESYFQESYISNSYYIINEVLLTNSVSHSWDYGIYDKSTNTLQMVIDLDGAYFHADICDYDGLHSREEYDEKRLLSVPDGIKVSIINEMKFKYSFENMIKSLMIDYDSFVEYQFNLCRSMPFPSPKYTDIELIKSYNQLCKMNTHDKYHKSISLRNREGDRIINHFHESIYKAKHKGSKSPFEAWHDDKLLRKVIKNRIIYINTINPNKILQGFNISKTASKISTFSAGRAKILIDKYLSKYDEIFDPFSGFSGRMLGTISLGKHYIGQDISTLHVTESNQIISFLKSNGIEFNANIIQKDILESSGTYECLFTCPPYEDIEQWYEVPLDHRKCDDWITECLNRFKCKRYLFVVDNTEIYKNYIVDEIINKSHFGSNKEYVIMICRE